MPASIYWQTIMKQSESSLSNNGLQQSINIVSNLSLWQRLRHWQTRNRDTVVAYSILAPMIIYFSIFVWLPVLFLLALSLSDWNIITWPPDFVGVENYVDIFTDSYYHKIILNTLFVGVTVTVVNLVLGFCVALMLNQNIPGKGIFRTIWYIPVVLSGAVVAEFMTVFLLPTERGSLNMILQRIFDYPDPILWSFNANWMLFWMIVFTVWRTVGWVVIFFLSGLQSLDPALDEAAKIDGANYLQILFFITIPQLVPVILFASVTGVIGGLQVWEFPLIVSEGGPFNATNTLVFSMYRDAFGNLDVGSGSAQAMLLLVALTGAIGIQLYYYRRSA